MTALRVKGLLLVALALSGLHHTTCRNQPACRSMTSRGRLSDWRRDAE